MPELKVMPDKWVRKAIFDTLNGITVNGVEVTVYDYRITVEQAPEAYILITGQTTSPEKGNKCEYDYSTTVQLEVITQYAASGNIGSRLLNDDVTDMVRASITSAFALDGASGLKILYNDLDFGVGAVLKLPNYTIYRKPITATFYVV